MKIKVTLREIVHYEWFVQVPDDMDIENTEQYVEWITVNEDFNRGEQTEAEWNAIPVRADSLLSS